MTKDVVDTAVDSCRAGVGVMQGQQTLIAANYSNKTTEFVASRRRLFDLHDGVRLPVCVPL